jgi:beta-lactamase regulating signal transducer with metallopeptidase domain
MSAELVLELLVKSSVIAGAGLALSAALGSRPAADRVDVLRAAVCVLLALPLIMALLPALQLPLLPAAGGEPLTAPPPVWQGTVTPVDGLSLSSSVRPPSPMEMLAGVWMLGALVVFGRFALGVLTLWRWTRSGAPVTDDAWTAPIARFGAGRPPRLVVSPRVEAPLSWGLPPGVVLIGKACLARPENAGAVMAHELAHIRRGDWLFLGLSRLALALFWFSPLVWLLHVTLASRTEDAADAAALTAVDRRTYARALVGLAADFRQSAAIGMAGDAQSLTRRITRIMTARPASRPRPLTMALAIGALIAVATPLAAVDITQRAPRPPAPPSAPPAPPTVLAVSPPAPPAPPVVLSITGPSQMPQPPAPPAPPAPPVYPGHPAPPAPPAPPARRIGLSAQERIEVHRAAAAARAQAAEARAHATEARASAAVHVAAATEARARAHQAEAEAGQIRVNTRAIEAEVARQMVTARAQMRQGADQMVEGARQMRRESQSLRDPAYRARQIERARERGDHVPTDAELEALVPQLARQADELEQQAVQLREQGTDPS